jgi:hypothetical protein
MMKVPKSRESDGYHANPPSDLEDSVNVNEARTPDTSGLTGRAGFRNRHLKSAVL